MTKAELIERVASNKELPKGLTKKAVGQIIEAMFTELGDYFIRARGSRSTTVRFTYPGFGTFSKRRRNPRMVRNPQNGTPIPVPAQTTVVFAPGTDFKELLNQSPRLTHRG